MLKRLLNVFAIVLGMLAIPAVPAMAESINSASATVTCKNYSFLAFGSGVFSYAGASVMFQITLTATDGSGTQTISSTIPVTADSQGNFSVSVTSPFGPLTGNFTLNLDKSVTFATLVDENVTINTINITSTTTEVDCQGPPPPPPPTCVGQSTNTANFNGTPISPGSTIWFNANFTAAGIPSTGATINFSSTVQLGNMTLTVPNSVITFSPSAKCASTSFDSNTSTWMTIVPLNGGDEIFLAGLAFPVPAGGIPGGVKNVAWNGNFSTNTPGISIQWKWGAAVYTSFTDYNSLNVKASHQNACNVNNGDHAGTPENPAVKSFVIGGATGGGGSNWTGSWSGTVRVGFICQ